MPGAKRYAIGALCLLSGALCGAFVSEPSAPSDQPTMDQAIESLHAGRPRQAERIAQALAQDPHEPAPRAWLVVGESRLQQNNYEGAVHAYRKFLAACDSPGLRRYATSQIRRCQAAMQPQEPQVAPSKRLPPGALADLARVDDTVYIESSDHFVVRSRNAILARLVADEAEVSLRRICREILNGQEYAHSVDINVWTTRAEYLASSPGQAPEWSDGSFSIRRVDGALVRRIDLTQLDEQGEFSTVMLDRILPHELCHLVLDDFFGDAPCPLAIDEGLAMLAEPELDNSRLVLAGTVLAGTQKIPLDRLLVMRQRDVAKADVFYAQALSFLDFLHARLSRAEFKAFLEHVKAGCSVIDALQRAMGVPPDDGMMGALAAAWERHAVADSQYLQALYAMP